MNRMAQSLVENWAVAPRRPGYLEVKALAYHLGRGVTANERWWLDRGFIPGSLL